MKRYLVILLGILLLVSILLVSACTSSPTPSNTAPVTSPAAEKTTPSATTPQYGGTLRIFSKMQPSIDIGYQPERDFAAGQDIEPCVERLIHLSDKYEPTPVLATAWKMAPDNLSCTITLRQGVKFQDGSDFNATVAVWNINRMIDTKLSAYRKWDSASVVDNNTVLLKLKSYSNDFIGSLAGARMISEASVEKNGKDWAQWHPVGTGPFEFVSFTKGVSLKFKKWDGYWQQGKPYLDAVEFTYFTDEMTEATAFMAGQADIAGGFSPPTVATLMAKGYEIAKPLYGAALMRLQPDTKHADSPFSDPKVVQAVSYAIDRQALCDARGNGLWFPTEQFQAPGLAGYLPDLQPRGFDQAKARELLKEAGHPNGFDTQLIPDSFSQDPALIVALQGQLKEVGINAQIVNLDPTAFQKMYYTDGWHSAMMVESMTAGPNYASGMNSFVSGRAMSAHSEAYPDDYMQALDAALASTNIDNALEQKVAQLAWQENLQIPIILATATGDFLSMTPPGNKVHDSGLVKQQNWPFWDPVNCWLSK